MENDAFISVSGLTKSYCVDKQEIQVLKGVNFTINKGEIFGIIGFSGAGKSTLIRCVNRMEEPDSGQIVIGEHEITRLNKRELTQYRQKIGMIFQHFNLFDSKTIFQNIAFPLAVAHKSKAEIRTRVYEILELVGLREKANCYPGQLSGGQKQRVGIARALANSPDVLLSDEATSALDPQTTLSILDLLRDINRKLGLTILLITHQLEVIRYLCNNVAVLDGGRIVENGTVGEIFLQPKSETARTFININHDFHHTPVLQTAEGI